MTHETPASHQSPHRIRRGGSIQFPPSPLAPCHCPKKNGEKRREKLSRVLPGTKEMKKKQKKTNRSRPHPERNFPHMIHDPTTTR